MTIRHLKIFLAVVDTGSMTKAAKSLYITQPSVSQAIMEIEEYYNIKLFERLSKKLYITEAGEEFLSYARHIISLYEDMEQRMGQTRETSTLRIGASVTIGTHLLGQLSKEFLKNNKDVQIEAIVDNTSVIENKVLNSEVDFGLVEGIIHSEDIVNIPFMEDNLILICSPNHPMINKPYITLEELSQEELILREAGSGTRELFENTMLTQGQSLNIKWICNNSEAIKNAVMADMGISIISKMSVMREIEGGELHTIPIDGIKFKREFNIIYHKNKYVTEVMEKFWGICARGTGDKGRDKGDGSRCPILDRTMSKDTQVYMF